MKSGEPGLRARAVFPSETAIRALQQPHRGRRALAAPFLVSLLLCAGLALTPARTEAAYAATELASLPVGSSRVVRAANDADEIVGSARRGGGHRGFLLKSGRLQEIAGLPGSDYSAALGINNLGHVVGSANIATGMRAFRSRRTTGIVALGTLPGDSGSVALAINHPGQAVGYSSGPSGVRAVVWTPDGRHPGPTDASRLRLGPRPRNQRWRGCRRSLRHRLRAACGALGGRRRSGSRHASRRRLERGAEHQCQRRDRRVLREPRGRAPRRALGRRAAAPSRISARFRTARRAGRSRSMIGARWSGSQRPAPEITRSCGRSKTACRT